MRLIIPFTALLFACGDKERQNDTQDGLLDEDGDGLLAADDRDDDDPAVVGEEVLFDGVDKDRDERTLDNNGDGDGIDAVARAWRALGGVS
jgi:hypothetical protein